MRRRQGREGRQARTPALFQRSQIHYPRSVPSQQPRQGPPVPGNRKRSRKRRGSPRSKEPGSPRSTALRRGTAKPRREYVAATRRSPGVPPTPRQSPDPPRGETRSPPQRNRPGAEEPPLLPPNPPPGTGTPARRKRPGTVPPPSPSGRNSGSAALRNSSAAGGISRQACSSLSAARLRSRTSSRARASETDTPKKEEAVSSMPWASSKISASARGG